MNTQAVRRSALFLRLRTAARAFPSGLRDALDTAAFLAFVAAICWALLLAGGR